MATISKFSKELIETIKLMLHPNPEKRPSANKLLEGLL
jgi:hypothetical protein